MRVVHVLTRFLRAGTEENTAITCNGQVRAGHDVWLVHGEQASPEALAMLDRRIQTIAVPSLVHAPHVVRDLQAIADLRALFRRLEADVVHTHQSKAGALGRLAAKLAGTRHVVHGVHIVPFMNARPVEAFVYRSIEQLLAQYTDAFINVAPSLRDACVAASVGPADKHFVVPSGMEVAEFKHAELPDDARRLARPIRGSERRPCVFLMVSALEPRKRHLPFLEVFRKVVERSPDVRLLLAGAGPQDAAIRAAIHRHGLGEHVELLGVRADVPKLIRLADVGVLASEREGLARSVIQYVLGGLPVVAADLPGMERLVTAGENGFLAPVDDLSPMEEALVSLAQDELLRRRMSVASQAVDLSEWAAEKMVHRIADVYRTIGASEPAPRFGASQAVENA